MPQHFCSLDPRAAATQHLPVPALIALGPPQKVAFPAHTLHQAENPPPHPQLLRAVCTSPPLQSQRCSCPGSALLLPLANMCADSSLVAGTVSGPRSPAVSSRWTGRSSSFRRHLSALSHFVPTAFPLALGTVLCFYSVISYWHLSLLICASEAPLFSTLLHYSGFLWAITPSAKGQTPTEGSLHPYMCGLIHRESATLGAVCVIISPLLDSELIPHRNHISFISAPLLISLCLACLPCLINVCDRNK